MGGGSRGGPPGGQGSEGTLKVIREERGLLTVSPTS